MKWFFVIIIILIIGSVFLAELLDEFLINRESVRPSNNDYPYYLINNLEIPWGLDFLPNNDLVLTERPGRVNFYTSEGELIKTIPINEVHHVGEGGLLGVVLHPDFSENQLIYLYYTYQENETILNKVVRYTWNGSDFLFNQTIIDELPGGVIHDGGRIKFGPDNKLYVTVGDAGNSGNAQDLNTLAGKILRLNDDGSVPIDNPFNDSLIYSYGHRNPQGLSWDDGGRLWATEHGQTATDELNLIEPGSNYGWPVILGDYSQEGMESPVIHSGSDTWAPSGMTFLNGSLYWAGLRGQTLYEYNNGSLIKHYEKQFGRLRNVVAHNGLLYLLTCNRDGRGAPLESDDKVIIVS